jgi:hypothetical protein
LYDRRRTIVNERFSAPIRSQPTGKMAAEGAKRPLTPLPIWQNEQPVVPRMTANLDVSSAAPVAGKKLNTTQPYTSKRLTDNRISMPSYGTVRAFLQHVGEVRIRARTVLRITGRPVRLKQANEVPGTMTEHPRMGRHLQRDARQQLLFALGRTLEEPAVSETGFEAGSGETLGHLASSITMTDFCIRRTHTRSETISLVEAGGLSGAVIWNSGQQRDALSLLTTIRSIDQVLPCWLVTPRATRQTLEAALALRVASVFTQPLEPKRLVSALRRVLMSGPSGSN